VVAEAIWYAALDLFGAQGYHDTTVEQIAEAAGVSRRTFFRYFSSKDEIVAFAMDAYGDLIVQAIQESAHRQRPIEIVRAAVMRVAEFVVAQPTARRAMQITDEYPEVKAAQLSRLHRIESSVAAAFCRALTMRNHHHPHAAALAGTTLMLIDATLRTWYREGAPVGRTVDALIEPILLLGQERRPAVRRRRHSRGRSAPGATAPPISRIRGEPS
jgi:AcrR family transcriptional regulator